jgi:hypothetical protein
MNYTLGPPLETYGPNPRTVGIIVVIGGMFCGFAYAVAAEAQDKTAWAVLLGMTAVFVGLLLHHLLSRVWVHDLGISFRGLFGYGELRWQDVEQIYFYAYEVHAHWIPLGTFYRLKLVSTHGPKVSLGERIRHAEDLAQSIGKATLERLLEKAVQEFKGDSEVDFGAILVSRAEGVTIRKWHGDKRIRWEEIAGYDFTASHVGFHRIEKRFTVNVGTERVANALVLRALLDGVMRKVWSRSVG